MDRTSSGTISSFNNNSGLGIQLVNHNYVICIQQVDGYCDVALTATSFDLDGTAEACNDKLVLGASTYFGSTFGTANVLTCKHTKAIILLTIVVGQWRLVLCDHSSCKLYLNSVRFWFNPARSSPKPLFPGLPVFAANLIVLFHF